MSTSTDAILAYGYDLGGFDGWKIRDLSEYGELPPLGWYDDDGDFPTAAERRLLTEIAEFTETDWRVSGYFDRKREAEARVGVKFGSYCSDGCPSWLLAAHITTVSRGDVDILDPVDLLHRPVERGWDAKLAAAIAALGITPVQVRPQWLLCSYWG